MSVDRNQDPDLLYCNYLLTSEVDQRTAGIHKEIVSDHFVTIFKKHGCKNVLDVGCGLGHFVRNSGPDLFVTGVDANEKVVKYCNDNGMNVVRGSAEDLPFEDDSMDGIMCAHLLEHLSCPETAMNEMYRVLRKDGLLIVRVPPNDPFFYDDWTHVKPYTKKSLKRLAAICGFNNIQIYVYHYDIPFRRWRSPLLRLVNKVRQLYLIRHLVDKMIRIIFDLPAHEIVLIARKPDQ